jgi:hypothetical protein
MIKKFMFTLSCLMLAVESSMQASRFATINIGSMTIQNDGLAIFNGNSYLGYDELGLFAKRLYVKNTPTVAALSNTECVVFGVGATIIAALVGCVLYGLCKQSKQEKQDQETEEVA